MKLKTKLFIICTLICLSLPCFSEDKRVALVIGNAKYKNNPLDNPVNDAKDFAAKLRTLNFEVSYVYDAETKEMDKALKDFYSKAHNADLALFYYSGHGIESEGNNYLIPVNNDIDSEEELERQAVKLERIMDKICGTDCGKYIIILDACRNNPIKKMRGSSRGLQTVSASNSIEGITLYACASGQTADDGNKNHSPFTKALLDHISDENVPFTQVIATVIKDVKAATNNNQVPYFYGSTTDIYLNGRSNVYIPPHENIQKEHNTIILPIVLFIILFISMIFCFIIFTAKGKEVLVVVKNRTIVLKNSSVDFAKRSTSSLKEKVQAVSESKKAKSQEKAQKREQEKQETQNALAEQNRIESERQSFMKATLIQNRFYCAEALVSVAQYNQLTGIESSQNDSDLPVTNVSYFEAASFMNLLSQKQNLDPVYDLSNPDNIKMDKTKNGWRLPNESEWKQAYGHKSLKGMTGLVWQWCNDSQNNKYILKGGAWDCSPKYINSSSKMMVVKEFKSDAVGIRGVRNK